MFIRRIGIGNFSDVLALQMMIHTVPKGKSDSSFVLEVWEYAPVKSVCCMNENEKVCSIKKKMLKVEPLFFISLVIFNLICLPASWI